MAEQKAAEALIQKVINGLVDTAVKEWNYIYKFNDNVESVRAKAGQLKGVEVNVEEVVNVAKWGGKLTGGDTDQWKKEVSEIKSNSDKILEEAEKVNKGFWKGRLNVFRRFSLSREAENLDVTITKLIDRAQIHVKVGHGSVPAGMLQVVKGVNHDALKSRKVLLDNVMEALQEDENYMIGVWGMAGVGKTTLADEVKSRVIEGQLFSAAIKVVVSKDVNIPEIQDVIASNLGLTLEGPDEDGKARRLQSRLRDDSKNLIILDNVWEEVPLYRIGLPLHGMQKGCKVLVTSRNHLILRAMGANSIFVVEPLLHPEARQLFNEIAGEIPKGDIVEKLTDECGGLPLAIKTVASTLVNRDLQVWENALGQLKKFTAPKEFRMEDHVYAPIKVNYNHLKSDSDAQRLLLLCCLFPEEADIPIQKLVRYVKGLKLLNVSDSLMDTSCYVFTLLDILMNYSLLLHGDKDTTVKINHVVRAVCLSISSNEDKNRLNVKHKPKLRKWPYKKEERQPCFGISLTFDDQMRKLDLPVGLDYPGLELLQLQFHSDSLNLSENTFKGMTEVRVLDFKRMTLWGTFIQIEALLPVLNMLKNLQTLCIEFCDLGYGDLALIEGLKDLEILSFFGSKHVSLPIEIQHLTNLKLLDLRCAGTLEIPRKVLPVLTMLEELYLGDYDKWLSAETVQSGEATGILITELSELPLLRVLQVRVNKPALLLELNEEVWFERLMKFQIVAIRDKQTFLEYEIGRSITLHGIKWKPLLKAKIHKLLKITESLKLVSTTFRNLFVEFPGLKSLELEKCDVKFIMDKEDSAETLNKLNFLNIVGMRSLVAICKGELPSKSLANLETIKLDSLPVLEYLWRAPMLSGCLGHLRLLDMSYCATITSIFPFSVAKGLVQLEKLDIKNCKELKWIVSNEEDEKTSEKIVLTKLSYLSLDELPKFCSFFPDSVVKTSAKVTSEKVANLVQKSGCSWLPLKRQAFHIRGLSVCKDIPVRTSNVSSCHDQQVLEHDDERNKNNPLFNKLVELSSMKKLLIGSMDNMEHVVDDQTSSKTVSEIKIMVVTNCQHLLDLAASEQSIRSLQNLEQVKVENCESMEALFNFGKHNGAKPNTEAVLNKLATINLLNLNKLNQVLLKVPENTSCFENLRSLEISNCGSLKYIFSVSIAKNLEKLEDLKVKDCAKVEEIIEIEGGNKTETTDLIDFSCLRVLHLENLASISSFSSGNHEFNFPKLKDMLLKNCPIMNKFCRGQVRARLLYEVIVGDHQEAEDVPDEDALDETISKLHKLNNDRLKLASEIEEV